MSTDAAYVRGLSPEDYLEHTQVGVFLEDMTLQVLARRAERPVEFMAQYAREAASMALPVVGRGWAFIRSSTKSRRCFAAAAYVLVPSACRPRTHDLSHAPVLSSSPCGGGAGTTPCGSWRHRR